jgi:ribosomal protein S18 acetylase RimI-like enzyme
MVSVIAGTAVREARPTDFDAIRAIASAANEEFLPAMGETTYRGYIANVLDLDRRAREALLLVAELDGQIVGTITLYRDINGEGMPVHFPDGTAGIRATAVSPAARGQGIGSELVTAALERARGSGAKAIALHTATCMRAAMRLYERHGFQRAPAYDFRANEFFTAGDGAALDALAFVRALDAGSQDTTRPPSTGRPARTLG